MTYREYLNCKKPYQEYGSLFLLERKHACLYYKPGKGKTFPCIDAVREIDKSKNGKANVLVLSTADAIKNMWNAEIVPQNILPENTILMSFNSAIQEQRKQSLLKIKWDVIVIDECLPGYVEILTNEGYKRLDTLNKTELIAQYTDAGEIEFVKPIEYIEQNYDDLLYEFNYKHNRSLPMTKNHVQPFYINGRIEEHYAKEMYSSANASVIFAGNGCGQEITLSTLEKLAIAMQADGSTCYTSKKDAKKGLTRWAVDLRKSRKTELLNKYLNELHIESKYWKDGTVQTFLLPDTITKVLSDTFDFTKFSKEKAVSFIDEIIKWDGYRNGNNIDYKSIVKGNADFVCAVATLAGYSSHIVEVTDKRFDYANVQYRVCIHVENIRNCQGKYWSTRRYKGKVYCVKVPSKKIVVRSDGYTLVTGNCHKIKAHNTKISKLVYSLSKYAEYVFGLSGTPRGNSDIDIYCQFHNMNIGEWGTISYTNFVENCCILDTKFFGGQCIKQPIGIQDKYKAGWERNISMYTQRVEYSDEDNMPDLDVNLVELPYIPTKEYLDAEQGVIQLSEYETTMTKLSATLKLQQAVNGFLYLTDNVEDKREVWHIERNKKLDWLKEHVPFGGKTIIVYRFAADLEAIKQEFSEVYYTDNVEEFKTDKNKYILLLQCSRCESFNLQMCSRIIFYTMDYSYIKYNQMLHRVWRMGQSNAVQINILTFGGTIETKIWNAVKTKQKFADLFMSLRS